ncbi:Alpha/Beta hydrolase protein [Globomyces pollinis-pini]|nr:Alpha/Beta hydrolase protein [Globomyces pollinis-pini]
MTLITGLEGNQIEIKLSVNRIPTLCVIIAHPYGPLGGNMYNNVVAAVEHYFHNQGLTTVKFNFRGCGNSSGRTSWNGTGETNDVISVANYVESYYSQNKLGSLKFILCGYSYGSVATTHASTKIPNLCGLINISYPSQVLWALTAFNQSTFYENMKEISTTIPKLCIIGSKDNFSSVANWKSVIDTFPDPKTIIVVDDADHFWLDSAILIQNIDHWYHSNIFL